MSKKFVFHIFSLPKLYFCTFGAHLGPKNDFWAKNSKNEFLAQKWSFYTEITIKSPYKPQNPENRKIKFSKNGRKFEFFTQFFCKTYFLHISDPSSAKNPKFAKLFFFGAGRRCRKNGNFVQGLLSNCTASPKNRK